MKRYIQIILIITTLFFTGCKKYLDVKPYGKVVPKTTEEFDAILQNRLNEMDYGKSTLLIGNFNSVVSEACYADNLDASIWVDANIPVYVGGSINNIMADYSRLYGVIKDVNIIIENIEENTSKDKEVLATSYAMRGISYFNLLQTFCKPYDPVNVEEEQSGVPLVTKFDIEKRPLRSTISETIDLIEKDLKKAISYNMTNEDYRFTKDVVEFFLARLYFYTENWNELIPLAESFTKKYDLLAGDAYKEMLNSKYEKKGNVLLKTYLFADGSSDLSFEGIEKQLKSRPVSVDFINLFKEKEKDVRYALSFNDKRETVKIPNAKLRAAEVYFMLAEAFIKTGSKQKGLDIINDIRDKRITDNVRYTLNSLPPVDSDYLIKKDCEGDALSPLMYLLLTERQKEFFMEGDRWWELKRNGSPEFWVGLRTGLKYTTKKYMYTAPISIRDYQLIKGLKQNEGYEF